MTGNRMCDACGGVDDHPRHVHGVITGDGLTPDEVFAKALDNCKSNEDILAIAKHARDDTTVSKHLDCCADDGCPDGSCELIHSSYGGDSVLKGESLRKHLTSGKVDEIGKRLSQKAYDKALSTQEEGKS